MKRRMAMLVAVTAVSGVMVMFSPTGTPAQAAVHDECVGLGQAHLSSPFTYPVSATTTGGGGGTVQVSPHSANFTFSFTTAVCVPSGATSIHASGTVHGWCGVSIGSGTVHTAPNPDFHWIGIGGTLVVTGEVSGVVNAAPNALSGDSCVTGADDFFVNGTAAGISCVADPVTSQHLTSVTIPPTETSATVTVSVMTTHTGTGVHVRSHGHLGASATACVPGP